jgi:hypothetical protein
MHLGRASPWHADRPSGSYFLLRSDWQSQAWAQTFGTYPGPYLPDGPNVPTVALTLGNEGAAGLPRDTPPPPNGFDQQSIWNMRVVGFNDNQGRASSDDGWTLEAPPASS